MREGREAADADGAKCERRRRRKTDATWTDGRTDVALSCGLVRRRRRGEREAGRVE